MTSLQDGARRFSRILPAYLPLLVVLLYAGSLNSGNYYGPTHYLLTYRHGFIKRGLLGEALQFVFPFVTARDAAVIGLAGLAAATALAYWIFRRQIFGAEEERWLFAFLFCGPAVLSHFGVIVGQLDVFLFCVALLGGWAVVRLPAVAAAFALASLSIAGMLVHEAFALMFYPVLALLLFEKSKRRNAQLAFWAQVICVAAAFMAILHFGKLHVPAAVYWQEMRARAGFPLATEPLVVLSSSAGQQLRYVWGAYTKAILGGAALAILMALPYFYLLARLVRDSAGKQRRFAAIAATLCVPGLLVIAGHDLMRWISAIAIQAALYIAFRYADPAQPEEIRVQAASLAAERWFLAIFLYSLVLGPFGSTTNRLAANADHVWQRLRVNTPAVQTVTPWIPAGGERSGGDAAPVSVGIGNVSGSTQSK